MCWVKERMEKDINDNSVGELSFKGTNSKSNDLSILLEGFYEVLIKSIERYKCLAQKGSSSKYFY